MVEVTQSARDAADTELAFEIINLIVALHESDALDKAYPEMLERIDAIRAAAEHRAHIAGMREAAGIARKKADTIRSMSQMGLPVMPSPIVAEDRAKVCEDLSQAIRQRATAIETGAHHD